MRTLTRGDCFGEIAALSRTPRTATVIAQEPCRLLRLEGGEFVLAVTSHRFAEQVAYTVARERLRDGTA
jgi:CRP-like cAMP-binding protein